LMNPTTVIYLLRHGETEGPKKVYKGHLDVPLSKTGQKQAKKVAQHLKNYIKRYELKCELCYCSPLKRAVETSEILCQTLSLQIKPLEILKER
ncbi:MAG: histidine phosphatase family protein, partial [Thermodesulfovibrio sp.]|nr:histidine phosphatase family protein [Thermodesulfovibrio sp.]